MAKSSKAQVPHVTKRDIQEFLDLEEQARSLKRQAKAIEKKAELIEKTLFAFVRANGGKERSVLRSGFVLAITDSRCSVTWKNEFIRVAGDKAAEALIEAAPKKEKLTVTQA